MNQIQLPSIVRYGELQPCRTAFIDTHTPGSDQKENFTIIGKGVSESRDQHVHLNLPIGFNTGAAGQPPKCHNSLHSHTTAEVFFVLSGRWRFFWGRWGNAGEVVLEEGDLFNIPTGVFRGFENVGTDYGMIMSILGGDDSGGGVTWAPQVIEAAREHGLMLGDNGVLYDSKQGQSLPQGVQPMPLLTEEQLKAYAEPDAQTVVTHCVARYQDMLACAKKQPCGVIAAEGALLRDRPGFTIELVSSYAPIEHQKLTGYQVLIGMAGHWQLDYTDSAGKSEDHIYLNAGDTCLLPTSGSYSLKPAMSGQASIYRITPTEDHAGASRIFEQSNPELI